MRRAAIKINVIAAVAVVCAMVGTTAAYVANSPSHKVSLVSNAQQQVVQISYRGQNDATALSLLQKHAAVRTKHYSFGDMVVSINGTVGNGPKYWTFYINGRMASVGASAYHAKSTDSLMWKLQ